MSYDSAQLFEPKDVFSGGFVDNTPEHSLNDKYSPLMLNCRLDGMAIVSRPGHSLFVELTPGTYPKGIGSYLRSTPGDDRLIVRHNTDGTHKLYTIDEDGVEVSIDTGSDIISDNRMHFTNIGDVIYCMNGSDNFGKLTGSIYSTPNTGIDDFSPNFGVSFNGSHFVAGFNTYVPAFLTGVTLTMVPANWQTVTDGGFKITIDGTERTLAGLNFSGISAGVAAATVEIAAIIQAGVRALTGGLETVSFTFISGSDYDIVISSVYKSVSSSITVTSDNPAATTDIGSNVFMGTSLGNGDVTATLGTPNVVYKSVGDDYEDFNGTGSDQLVFEEIVTGLAVNSQALFYFTKNTVSVTGVGDIQDIGGALSYLTRPLQSKEGSVNHASIVTAGSKLFYITPSNKIVQIFKGTDIDGFEVLELSERKYKGISKLMSTLDLDQNECFGYFLPKENLIKWFFRSAGATFNDVCIVYDVTKDEFLPDTNKYFYGGVDFKGKNYTISNIEAKVYLDETGYDDEDAIIGFRHETRYFDLQLPTRKKELWEGRTYVAINSLAELKQEIVIDGNIIDTKTIDKDNIPISVSGIGTGAIGVSAIGTGGGLEGEDDLYNVGIIRTKGNLQVKGYRVKIIHTNNTLAGRVRLESLELKVELLSPEADNLTK